MVKSQIEKDLKNYNSVDNPLEVKELLKLISNRILQNQNLLNNHSVIPFCICISSYAIGNEDEPRKIATRYFK